MKALAILLALSSVAVAQPKKAPATDKYTKAAGEAFSQATAADAAGDLRVALGLYQKAHAISPHPATMYNIADVHRRLGQLRDAIKGFETYLVMAPDAQDRAAVEKTLDTLYQTPGTLSIITLDQSNPEALDLTAGYVIVSGDLKKKPGPVEFNKGRSTSVITLTVQPGEHVVDFITPITYATKTCEVGPGEQRWCELRAEPRIDGNVVVSATSRRLDVKQDRRGKDLTYKRFELPHGTHRLMVKDRNYGCAPLSVITAPNAISYSFIRTTEFEGFKRCRKLDLRQHRLQFDP